MNIMENKNCSYYHYFDGENNYHCTLNLSCLNEYPKLLPNKNECVKDNINKYETSEIIYELETTSELFVEELSSINKQIIKAKGINKIETTEISLIDTTKIKSIETTETNIIETTEIKAIETTEIKSIETTEIEQTEKIKKIFNFDDIIRDIFEKCKKNDTKKEMSEQEEINCYNKILKKVESIFTDINFDTSEIDGGDDRIIKTEKLIIALTTTNNQKNKTNNIDNNMTLIDLGDCEKDLRDYYNISDDKKLYMKKIDIIQEGMKISKIEYDVYCKLNNTNLIKLNISVYKNSQVSFSIPIEISENVDKLNSSSDYFNDICYTSTSDSGTDISLEDRKKVFINENKIICQEDCYFSEYNSNTKKVKCSCDVKQSSISFANMTINKTKLSYIYIKKYIKII